MKKLSLRLGCLSLIILSLVVFPAAGPTDSDKGQQITPSLLSTPEAGISSYITPHRNIIIPEVIWAPATGGGTWVTELQITSLAPANDIQAWYYYGTSWIEIPVLCTLDYTESIKFTNILQHIETTYGHQLNGTVGLCGCIP